MRPAPILALTLLAGLGCGESPTAPLPGVFDVVLAGPAAEAGGLLFDIMDGPVDSVAAAGTVVVSAPFTGVSRRVLVIGNQLDGVVARVFVPDVSVSYQARIVEVADRRSYALRDSTSFSLLLVVRRF